MHSREILHGGVFVPHGLSEILHGGVFVPHGLSEILHGGVFVPHGLSEILHKADFAPFDMLPWSKLEAVEDFSDLVEDSSIYLPSS